MFILRNTVTHRYYVCFEDDHVVTTDDPKQAKVLLSEPAVRAIEKLLPDLWERIEHKP